MTHSSYVKGVIEKYIVSPDIRITTYAWLFIFFISQELTHNSKGGLQTHEKVVKAVNKGLRIFAQMTMVVKKNPTQPQYYILIYNWYATKKKKEPGTKISKTLDCLLNLLKAFQQPR